MNSFGPPLCGRPKVSFAGNHHRKKTSPLLLHPADLLCREAVLRQHLVAPKGPLQGANDGVHCNAFFSFNKGKRGEWVADAASESRLKIWEKEEEEEESVSGGGAAAAEGREREGGVERALFFLG